MGWQAQAVNRTGDNSSMYTTGVPGVLYAPTHTLHKAPYSHAGSGVPCAVLRSCYAVFGAEHVAVRRGVQSWVCDVRCCALMAWDAGS